MRRTPLSILFAAVALLLLPSLGHAKGRLTIDLTGSGLNRSEAMQIKHAIAQSLNKLQKTDGFTGVKVSFQKITPANAGMLGVSGLKIVGQVEQKVGKKLYLGGVTFEASVSKPITPQAKFRIDHVKVTGKLRGLAAGLTR